MEITKTEAETLLFALAVSIQKETEALAAIDCIPCRSEERYAAARARETLLRKYSELRTKLSREMLVGTFVPNGK